MKNSTILKRAKKLVEDPEWWVQHYALKDGRCCMGGAIALAMGVDLGGERMLNPREVEEVWADDLAEFNDAPDTTHDDVMMAFDFAILMAEDEERSAWWTK